MISCEKCSLEDLLEYTKNTDEAYLDFLTKYDEGKIPDKKQMSLELKTVGIIRDEKEIKEMIGSNTLDELTKSVLYSKKDYVSIFKTLKKPPPKLGCKVDELGIDENLSKFLQKIGIKKFYKFQEDAIKEIAYGGWQPERGSRGSRLRRPLPLPFRLGRSARDRARGQSATTIRK